jgi:hypothetical protein
MRNALFIATVLISGGTVLSGCAAVRAQVEIVRAEQSVAAALDKNAQELATYEYTMALRHLEKSREEAGYADYRVSVELARASATWADKSIIVIDEEGRDLDMDRVDEDFSDDMKAPGSAGPDPMAPEGEDNLDWLDKPTTDAAPAPAPAPPAEAAPWGAAPAEKDEEKKKVIIIKVPEPASDTDGQP